MEVLNARSALLSNYEVLSLLRELDTKHIEKTRLELKKIKEEPGSKAPLIPPSEVSENLRTVEVEAIQHLSADYQPTGRQTEAGIVNLTQSLSAYDLTKAEKLQIVNLAPTQPVELYVIVEELEDRLGDSLDNILSTVGASLSSPPTTAPATNGIAVDKYEDDAPIEVYDEADEWNYDANEMMFDDAAADGGVEDDLDVEED